MTVEAQPEQSTRQVGGIGGTCTAAEL